MVNVVRRCALFVATCAHASPSSDTVTFPFNKPATAHYNSIEGPMSKWNVFEMECFHFLYAAVGKQKSSGELRDSLKALCVGNAKDCDSLTTGILSAVDAKYAKTAKRPYRDWCSSVFVAQGGVVTTEETHHTHTNGHHEKEAVEAKAMKALTEADGAAGTKAHASNPHKVARRASEKKQVVEKKHVVQPPAKVNPTKKAEAPPAPKVKAPHHAPSAPKVKATHKVEAEAAHTKAVEKVVAVPTKHQDPPKVEVPEDAAPPAHPRKSLRQIFGETVEGSAAGLESGIEGLAIADKAEETHASASEMKSADDLLDGALGAAKSLGKKHHSDHSMMRWRRRSER